MQGYLRVHGTQGRTFIRPKNVAGKCSRTHKVFWIFLPRNSSNAEIWGNLKLSSSFQAHCLFIETCYNASITPTWQNTTYLSPGEMHGIIALCGSHWLQVNQAFAQVKCLWLSFLSFFFFFFLILSQRTFYQAEYPHFLYQIWSHFWERSACVSCHLNRRGIDDTQKRGGIVLFCYGLFLFVFQRCRNAQDAWLIWVSLLTF